MVQRGGVTDEHSGSFDTYPVINSVSNYSVRYDNANPIVSGTEIPLNGKVYDLYSNNVTGVTLSADSMLPTILNFLKVHWI